MQTTGEAVVSFLLRPASLLGKVVFAGRRGRNPLFTSYVGMYGQEADRANGDEFARRYFSVCGASDIDGFTRFSGLSRKSAQRMIDMLSDESVTVMLEGRRKLAIDSLLPEMSRAETSDKFSFERVRPLLDIGERFLAAPERAHGRRYGDRPESRHSSSGWKDMRSLEGQEVRTAACCIHFSSMLGPRERKKRNTREARKLFCLVRRPTSRRNEKSGLATALVNRTKESRAGCP